MTALQTKKEIEKIIVKLPEDKLTTVLDYLKQVEKVSNEELKLAQNLKQILVEDSQLLEKLAQ